LLATGLQPGGGLVPVAAAQIGPSDAFVFAGASVTALAWAPLGGHGGGSNEASAGSNGDGGGGRSSPISSPQYLVVALHQPRQFLRLSGLAEPGLLLVYAVDFLDGPGQPAQAPRLVLALQHEHGPCISAKFYPHSLETFAPSSAGSPAASAAGTSPPPLQRLGVLAAAFMDGTVEVRALPKIDPASLPAAGAADGAAAVPVFAASLPSLPGMSLKSSFPTASPFVRQQHIPSALAWFGGGSDAALLAVGDSEGLIRVVDLEESTLASSSSISVNVGGASAVQSEPVLSEVRTGVDGGTAREPPSMVTGLSFHWSHATSLAACTLDGRVLVFDLRASGSASSSSGGGPSALLRVSTSTESCRALFWPRVAHPMLECLLVAQGNRMRVVPLHVSHPVKEPGKTILTAEWPPGMVMPVHEQAVLAACDAVPQPIQPSSSSSFSSAEDDAFVVAQAASDGTLGLLAENLDRQGSYAHRTAGASVSRWRIAAASASDGEASAAAGGAAAAVVPGDVKVQFSGLHHAGGVLDLSDGVGAESVTTREAGANLISYRSSAPSMHQRAYPGTAAELALEDQLPLTAVAVNPNVLFPRIVASAGMAGLMRIQCVTYL
jgi:hypothetical protein